MAGAPPIQDPTRQAILSALHRTVTILQLATRSQKRAVKETLDGPSLFIWYAMLFAFSTTLLRFPALVHADIFVAGALMGALAAVPLAAAAFVGGRRRANLGRLTQGLLEAISREESGGPTENSSPAEVIGEIVSRAEPYVQYLSETARTPLKRVERQVWGGLISVMAGIISATQAFSNGFVVFEVTSLGIILAGAAVLCVALWRARRVSRQESEVMAALAAALEGFASTIGPDGGVP